jgi:hypothetical protein
MSPERKMYDLYRKASPNHVAFDNTGSDTEQLDERDVSTVVDSSLGNGTLYMPPVSKCEGQFFTIRVTPGDTNTTTISDFGVGATTNTDCVEELAIVLTNHATNYIWVMLFCNGEQWYPISGSSSGCAITTPTFKVS